MALLDGGEHRGYRQFEPVHARSNATPSFPYRRVLDFIDGNQLDAVLVLSTDPVYPLGGEPQAAAPDPAPAHSLEARRCCFGRTVAL